jgi:competence protein ComEC
MDTLRSGPPVVGDVARRPAVLVAFCFALGIAAHGLMPHAPAVWLGGLALLLGAGWTTRRRAAVSSAVLAVGLIIAGAAAAQLAAFYYPRRHVSAFAGDTPRLAQLELEIVHPPRVLTAPYSPNHHPMPPKQVTAGRVTAVRTWASWEPASGEVLMQISQPHPRLAVGQTVRVVGMLQRPASAMNPGQFDWAAYYREQRILNSLQVAHADNIRILASPGSGPVEWLRENARQLLAAGFSARDGIDHALLRALLLGDNDPQLRDVQDQFKRTGTGHHLSISGMHVAVLGGFVFLVCRLLCLSPRMSALLMMAFVLLYGVVALPSPPAVRSVVLCLAFGLGVVSRRSVDALQLLALSVLVMLVYHPLDLYNAGFQLSFGTVLGLILFSRAMLRFFRRDPDVLALAPPRSRGLVGAVVGGCDRILTEALAAGLVAWGISLPLIAFHFEQLNPWAVGAGILLAPVVMLALVGGLLKVLLTLLWPGLASTWAALAAAPVAGMRHTVDWIATFPMGDVPVPPPPAGLMLAFYLLLVPALWPCHRAGLRWCLRGGRAVLLLLILLLPFQVGFARPTSGAGTTRVTLLSVGAGQCAVIEPPSGRTVLVDAGSTGMGDLVSRCLGPYLRHERCTSVDTILVSHANYDHFSAVAEVVEAYGAREVLTSGRFAEREPDNAAVAGMLATLAELQRPPREVRTGERIPLGRQTYVEVLWPPGDLPMTVDANDASLVLKLTHAGGSVLFTGDIQDGAMAELLKAPEQLRADVLVAPHHGSCERLTARFIDAVAPTTIVSSNDRTLTGRQREFDRITEGMPVLRTHRCGAITITFDKDGSVHVETMLRRPTHAGS